jgi:hypothetical protein
LVSSAFRAVLDLLSVSACGGDEAFQRDPQDRVAEAFADTRLRPVTNRAASHRGPMLMFEGLDGR